jgi:hypothetical protein
MSDLTEGITGEDNAFGPETDLILSLLVIILLVGVLAWFQANHVVKKIQQTQRILVFQEKASSFSRGSAEIRPDDERDLRAKTPKLDEEIRLGQFQYFEIAGAASPEVGRVAAKFDINLIKGYERAEAVANILHAAGMPYECMKLSTYGRATSEYLGAIVKENPGSSAAGTVHAFDLDPAAALKNETRLAGERRTEIWGIPPTRTDDGSVTPSVCMLLLSPSPR